MRCMYVLCMLMCDGKDCKEEFPESMHFSKTYGDYIFSMLRRKSGTKYQKRNKIVSCLIPSAPAEHIPFYV